MHLLLQKNVIWLKVCMNVLETVHVVERAKHTLEDAPSDLLVDLRLRRESGP